MIKLFRLDLKSMNKYKFLLLLISLIDDCPLPTSSARMKTIFGRLAVAFAVVSDTATNSADVAVNFIFSSEMVMK